MSTQWDTRPSGTLRRRITLAATALSVSVLVLVGMTTFVMTYRMMQQAVYSDLVARGRLVAQQLGLRLTALAEDAHDLAMNSFIANGLVDSTGRELYLLPFLRDHHVPFGVRVDLLLLDYAGHPFASNQSTPAASVVPSQLREAIQAVQPTTLLRPEADVVALYLLEPVFFPPTHQVEGFLLMRIDLRDLFEHTVSQSIGTAYHVALQQAGTTLLATATPGTPPRAVLDSQQALHLTGPLAVLPLTVVVAQDLAVAFAGLGRLIALWLLVSLVILGLVIFGAQCIARSLTHPLQELTATAQCLAVGDYSRQARVRGHDEIATLGHTLNSLREEIRTAQAELERRVWERTQQLEQSQHELIRAKDAAEEANRAKSTFLANMSHELRTPLHGILSFAGFGIKRAATASPEKLRSYFVEIDQSGAILLALLNDLLDIAKLEAGKTRYVFEDVALDGLIEHAVDEFRSSAAERQLTFAYTPWETPVTISLDPTKIRQVLRNLLSNAVKFSPDGGQIEITLHLDTTDVVIGVHDHGVGIPEGELASIFEQFVQSSRTKTGAGGTGLGLAICREIIAAHDGRIWAEHRPDGGAAFYMVLPQHPRCEGAGRVADGGPTSHPGADASMTLVEAQTSIRGHTSPPGTGDSHAAA